MEEEDYTRMRYTLLSGEVIELPMSYLDSMWGSGEADRNLDRMKEDKNARAPVDEPTLVEVARG